MTDWELKQRRADRENEQKGRDLARAMGKLVNVMGGNKAAEKGFIDELTNEHRTLQQSSFGLMLQVMGKWADDYENGRYDGRNEYALSQCKAIVDQNPDLFKYGVPMI